MTIELKLRIDDKTRRKARIMAILMLENLKVEWASKRTWKSEGDRGRERERNNKETKD